MEPLKSFATFIIFWDLNPERLKNLKISEDLYFDFREDPSKLNWHSNTKSVSLYQIPLSEDELSEVAKTSVPLYELLIYAKDENKANEVLEVLRGSILLQYPLTDRLPNHNFVMPADITTDLFSYYKNSDYATALYEACVKTVMGWNNEDLKYSIIKYVFSLNIDSISPHSADPYYGQVFSIEKRDKTYQVSAAYAFLSAYSIVEELGLEIRSSQLKPRFINDHKEWNPAVKDDVCNRLKEIGISEKDSFQWIVRGKSLQLVDNVIPKFGEELFDDATGEVRDLKVKIYDALHLASFIRNFYLAHKFNEIVEFINPYDIYNMQSLSRRLILSKLGCWSKTKE